MPQFYAVIVTGVLQRGEFPMNQLKETSISVARNARKPFNLKAAGEGARATRLHLVNRIQAGDFAGEERVFGKFIA